MNSPDEDSRLKGDDGTRRRRVFFLGVALTAVFCLFLEAVSGTALFTYYRVTHKPFPAALRFHPLFHGSVSSTAFNGESVYQYDPILGYRYRPFGVESRTLKICAAGFIDNYGCSSKTPDLFHKPRGTFRIFVVGDSTLAGSGASGNAFTITADLERMLNQRSGTTRYQVINFGVGAYTSVQELMLFENDIVRYHPDLVIFYNGTSDVLEGTDLGGYENRFVQQFAPMNFHEYYLYLSRAIAGQQDGAVTVDVTPLLHRFYTTTLLLKLRDAVLSRATREEPAGLERKVVNSPAAAAVLYLQNVQNTIAVAEYHHLPIAYFLEPTIWNKPVLGPGEGDRADQRQRAAGPSVVAFQRAVEPALARMEGSLDRATRRRVEIKSLRRLFEPMRETIFTDTEHMGNRGDEIVARRLLQELQPLLPAGASGPQTTP